MLTGELTTTKLQLPVNLYSTPRTKPKKLVVRVVLIDAKNTSQLCSNCGEIVPKRLSERVHRCDHCGYVQDRDVNAAQNILKRALA